MSKLRKSELKEIVKECLVEILEEGMGQSQRGTVAQSLTEGRHSSRANRTSFDHVKWQKENELENILKSLQDNTTNVKK